MDSRWRSTGRKSRSASACSSRGAGSAGGSHRSSTRTASNGATPATVKAMGQPYCSASTPVMNSETLEPTEKLAV